MTRVGAIFVSLFLLAACVTVDSGTPAPSGTTAVTPSPSATGTLQATPTLPPTASPTVAPTLPPTASPTASPTQEVTAPPTDAITPPPTDPAAACAPVQFPTDLGNEHLDQGVDFTGTYSSSPPASGPHDPVPTETGTFHDTPQRPEEVIHAQEHGAVVFWVNGLAVEQEEAAKAAVADIFSQGYSSLVWTPYADMDVPFAMSAWGTLQLCNNVDAASMQEFVDSYYGSGLEGFFACSGTAAELPACTVEEETPAPTDPNAFPDAAESALIEFVPAAFSESCARPFGETVGATADVDCFPTDLGADQASYAQFPSTAAMDDSYEETRAFLEVDSDQGQCSDPTQWPAENSYTIGGVPAGRLLCSETFGGAALIWWTDAELNIKSLAISSAGDKEALYQFWFNDSGPIRP